MGEHSGSDVPGSDPASAFMTALRELREEAGNPSFRKMAQLSGCVSHTTLHEAATGARFPSWETTREFVKACGADPEPWLARWKQARGEPEDPANDIQSHPEKEHRRAGHSRRRVTVFAGIALLVLGIATGVIVTVRGTNAHATVAKPTDAGDASRFIADVTIPDNTVVTVGQHFQKVWQIQNVGSVTWHGRYLQRTDLPPGPDTCRTPARAPIGDTGPGEMALISVNAVAPSTPGTCWVGWKMVDPTGDYLLPHYRPVYFLVRVVANRPAP
jgi:Ig-like domain from next to BRCA1 gene/Helix-turn-helix domain